MQNSSTFDTCGFAVPGMLMHTYYVVVRASGIIRKTFDCLNF